VSSGEVDVHGGLPVRWLSTPNSPGPAPAGFSGKPTGAVTRSLGGRARHLDVHSQAGMCVTSATDRVMTRLPGMDQMIAFVVASWDPE